MASNLHYPCFAGPPESTVPRSLAGSFRKLQLRLSVGKLASPRDRARPRQRTQPFVQLLSIETGGQLQLSYDQRHEGESCHKMNGASSGTDAPACCGTNRGV